MKHLRTSALAAATVLATLCVPARAAAQFRIITGQLVGGQETPIISTTGSGQFRGEISSDESSIAFELSYQDLVGEVTVAKIYFGQHNVNGGVVAFLCGGGGRPACPSAPGTVTGTITAEDIIGPEDQGISPGEFEKVLFTIRRVQTYANVHTDRFPEGEIRGQLSVRGGD